jgi:DNA primase
VIPDETVERVRDAADIVSVVSDYVKLKRSGGTWRGPCPFHHGKNPNFAVNPSRGIYHCFKCGAKGDVFEFVRQHLGVDFVDAVKIVGEKSGIVVEETHQRRDREDDPRTPLWEANAAALEFFERALWDSDDAADARAYLEKRQLTREVAQRYRLGYAPRGRAMQERLNAQGLDDQRLLYAGLLAQSEDRERDPYPRFRDRLMIPIFDAKERCVGFGGRLMGEADRGAKYLNSPETPVFQKGQLLYNLHVAKNAIRKAEHALVVEGYFDVIRVAEAGMEQAVAGLGTALTEEQAALLARLTSNVFLLYDSDEAGQKATFRAAHELLRQGMAVRVVTLPEGEDPDSFTLAHGAAGLQKALDEAMDVFERQVQILERRGWFADLHRKRRAVDRLLPTIRAASDPITRDLYVSRLAEAAGVSRDLVLTEVAQGDKPRRGRGAAHGDDPPPPDPPSDDRDSWPRHEDVAGPPWMSKRGERRRRFGRREEDGWAARPGVPRGSALGDTVAMERSLVELMLVDRGVAEVVAERYGPESFRDPDLRAIFASVLDPDTPDGLEGLAGVLPGELVELAQELYTAARAAAASPEFDRQRTLDGALSRLRLHELRRQIRTARDTMSIATAEEKNRLLLEIRELKREENELRVQLVSSRGGEEGG